MESGLWPQLFFQFFRETQALIRTSFEHLARQDDHLRQRVEHLERNDQN